MGCFTVFRTNKKKSERHVAAKRIKPQETTPTVLPEPRTHNRSLQSAPSSFKTRASPIQPVNQNTYSRSRTLSALSTLNVEERDALSSIEIGEHEDSKNQAVLTKGHRSPSPQPLPLPSRHSDNNLKNMASFKAPSTSELLSFSGPLPLPPLGGLKNFSYEEIAAACQQFSPDRCMSEGLSSVIYKASFGDENTGSKKLEATVTRLLSSNQGIKDFISEVNTLSSLQHPQLCKLIGFHTREGSDQRMLVYERLFHGSLDLLLYGRSDGPPIDWGTRMKVALCAAQGLAFLHEEGPFQAMYNDFSTANIQIDKDFSAKLSGYGCVNRSSEAEIPNTSPAVANLPAETLERGLLTPKSNVWSFGLVLLELLTGRKNLDCRHPKEERNLVKWSRPFLADDCRLSLIMDPRLKGRFAAKSARTVADIALSCLHKDPSERPTMRKIVESLKSIQDMKYSCRFPLLEPATITGKQAHSRTPSFNLSPSKTSLPSRPISVSPTRPPLVPMSQHLSPRSSTTVQKDALKGF